MAFSSGNDSGGPMAEINVTPLVDVMLVLLIIFIITAPLMQHKVKVELPKANLAEKPEHGTIKQLGLLPIDCVAALRHDHQLVVRNMACDHSHDGRRREHVGGAGHEQRPNLEGLQLLRRHDIHQLLPGPSSGL